MSGSYNFSKVLTCYGAALSTTMLATGVNAATVELTAIPTTISTSASSTVDITGVVSFAFDFLNTSAFGRSLYGLSTNGTGANFGIVNFSSTLTSGAGFGTTLNVASFGFDGTVFVGFETFLGNLGFIEFDFDEDGEARIVSAFASDTVGEAIHVGNNNVAPIPVPASLPIMAGGLLALGAVGLRKRRKARAAA